MKTSDRVPNLWYWLAQNSLFLLSTVAFVRVRALQHVVFGDFSSVWRILNGDYWPSMTIIVVLCLLSLARCKISWSSTLKVNLNRCFVTHEQRPDRNLSGWCRRGAAEQGTLECFLACLLCRSVSNSQIRAQTSWHDSLRLPTLFHCYVTVPHWMGYHDGKSHGKQHSSWWSHLRKHPLGSQLSMRWPLAQMNLWTELICTVQQCSK